MRGFRGAGPRRLGVFVLGPAFFALLPALSALAAIQAASPAPASQVDRGRQLFSGQIQMQNGGPPCGACHAIATVPFPNGGVVGPDLSGVYQMLGPEGTDAALQTLFFPTMLPIYQARPLTAPEQQALKAFFAQANGTSGAGRETLVLAALAVAGFLILVGVSWLAWRRRLRGVRAPLVRHAAAGGARP